MFKNYKKLYENLVNEIEWLWSDFCCSCFMEEEYTDEMYEGYVGTLIDFYDYYSSKYKIPDIINNVKIIDYRKRYLDIVKRIKNLHSKAMKESKFYGPNDKYINGFLDCTRDLLAIIKSE